MATRTRQSLSVIADASGLASYSFEPPPPGQVIVGSLCLPGAPTTAVSTLVIGPGGIGVTWGSWSGNATFGPVQAFGQETMQVDVSGLTPGTAYEAVFIGYSEADGPETTIIYPSAIATAVASITPTPVTSQFHGVLCQKSGATNWLSGTALRVPFDAADLYDTDGYHDPATNNTRITIPSGLGGYYLVRASLHFTTPPGAIGAGTRLFWELWLNGVTEPTGRVIAYYSTNATSPFVNSGATYILEASGILPLAVGDYIEIDAEQNLGGTMTITTASRFQASLIGV